MIQGVSMIGESMMDKLFAGYKFVPLSDITAYELACLLPPLLARLDDTATLKTIIQKWPLPEICRHLQPYGTKHESLNFEVELKELIVEFMEEEKPGADDLWWIGSCNRVLIVKWIKEKA